MENNLTNEALDLFNKIKNPSEVNIIVLFNACALLQTNEALDLVKKVSREMPKSFYSNLRLVNSLLDALVKCDDVKQAESLFNRSRKKTLQMYTTMMTGYNKANDPSKALDLFHQLKANGFATDLIIYHCLMRSLTQLSDYETSQKMVEEIPHPVLVDNQIRIALMNMWVSRKKCFSDAFQ